MLLTAFLVELSLILEFSLKDSSLSYESRQTEKAESIE